MDVRARRDQCGQAALGDLAAAEDDHSAAGEAEAYGVGGVFGHEVRLLLRRCGSPDVRILRGGRGGVFGCPMAGRVAWGAGPCTVVPARSAERDAWRGLSGAVVVR